MIDLSTLRHLMGNDENMVQNFLQIFKSQTPVQLQELHEYIQDENWEYVSSDGACHKKPSEIFGAGGNRRRGLCDRTGSRE